MAHLSMITINATEAQQPCMGTQPAGTSLRVHAPRQNANCLCCKPHNPEKQPSSGLKARLPGTHLRCLCWLSKTELQCRQAVAHGLIQARGLHVVHAVINLLGLEEQSLHSGKHATWAEHRKQELSAGTVTLPQSHCWVERVAQPQMMVDTGAFAYLLASAVYATVCAIEQGIR